MPSKKDKISTLNAEPDTTASKKDKTEASKKTKKVETEKTKKVKNLGTEAHNQVTEVPEKSKSKTSKKSKKAETEASNQVTEASNQVTEASNQVTEAHNQVTEAHNQVTEVPEKGKSKAPKKSKKAETDEPKKAEEPKKADSEVPKKGKAKKVLEPAPVVHITEKNDSFVEKGISTDGELNNSKKENDEPDDVEYEAVKKEWAVLCEQINVMNEEREVLELKKNKLLQKLCKLGENNMPKGENIFNINSKSKLDITNTILENDSDSSDSSDSDDSDSDDEPVISKKKVVIKKYDSDSDSD
jgi:hypothetical protein